MSGAVLTPHHRFLAERADEAVRDGLQLEQWIRATDLDAVAFPLELGKAYKLANRATGYYGSLAINGQATTVMGCRQVVEFGTDGAPATPERIEQFMSEVFLPRANRKNADGTMAGFTLTQELYKDAAGSLGLFPADQRKGCVDWRRLGADLQWVLLTVDIHDFVMQFGPFTKRLREAACVVPNGRFRHSAQNPSAEIVYSCSVGYPFAKFTPIPNFFGFGPGKFGTAVKLYTMRLGRDGRVSMVMDFAAAPRCEKVFDFGPSAPDPVYGGARLLEKLTFGAYKAQPLRDKMDAQMLSQHSRVHQALMETVEPVWRQWLGGQGR